MFEWVHWEYGVRSYSHKGHTHEDTCSNYLSWNVDTDISHSPKQQPLNHWRQSRCLEAHHLIVMLESLEWVAGATATAVSHRDDLDMVHIRRKKEKGNKRKKEKWGRGGERERERDAWSINSSKYFLRLLVFIKFSWPFELWEWNVNVQKHWRHCKMYFPWQCQAFHITQGSLIHIWVSLRLGQVDICSENSGTHDAFGQ